MITFSQVLNIRLTLLVSGHVEPQYDSSIKYTILEGTGIKDGSWIMNFVCMSSVIITRIAKTSELTICFRPQLPSVGWRQN